MPVPRLSLLLLTCFLGATALPAAPWAPCEARPLPEPLPLRRIPQAIGWPALGFQSTILVSDRFTQEDESTVRLITLSAGPQRLQLPFWAQELWVPPAQPTGRFGYELRHKFDDTARMGLSVISRQRFLRDLETNNWHRYLGSLGALSQARIFTNDDSAQNPQMIRVLGGRTRVLEYHFESESGDEDETVPTRAVMQVLVDNGRASLLVFTLECDALVLPELGPEFEDWVISFEYQDGTAPAPVI